MTLAQPVVPVRHGEQVHELVPDTHLSLFRRADRQACRSLAVANGEA